MWHAFVKLKWHEGIRSLLVFILFCAENSFFIAAKDKTPIKVTLRDGKVVDGQAWKTTPYDIASSIRYGLDLSKPVQSFDCPEIHV